MGHDWAGLQEGMCLAVTCCPLAQLIDKFQFKRLHARLKGNCSYLHSQMNGVKVTSLHLEQRTSQISAGQMAISQEESIQVKRASTACQLLNDVMHLRGGNAQGGRHPVSHAKQVHRQPTLCIQTLAKMRKGRR